MCVASNTHHRGTRRRTTRHVLTHPGYITRPTITTNVVQREHSHTERKQCRARVNAMHSEQRLLKYASTKRSRGPSCERVECVACIVVYVHASKRKGRRLYDVGDDATAQRRRCEIVKFMLSPIYNVFMHVRAMRALPPSAMHRRSAATCTHVART